MAEVQSPTERSRAHRQRRRQGILIVPLEIDRDFAEALARHDFLGPDEVGDRAKLAEALKLLLMMLELDAIEIDWAYGE